jgi:hypothetical protein
MIWSGFVLETPEPYSESGSNCHVKQTKGWGVTSSRYGPRDKDFQYSGSGDDLAIMVSIRSSAASNSVLVSTSSRSLAVGEVWLKRGVFRGFIQGLPDFSDDELGVARFVDQDL